MRDLPSAATLVRNVVRQGIRKQELKGLRDTKKLSDPFQSLASFDIVIHYIYTLLFASIKIIVTSIRAR